MLPKRIELFGTSRHMGNCFGEAFRSEIEQLYELRCENAQKHALDRGGRVIPENDFLMVAHLSIPWVQEFHLEGWQELEGIAQGSNLKVEKILALNGLTDYRDYLSWDEGCTLALIPAEGCADQEARIIQTWDLATNNQPFMVNVLRRPEEGPETWSVTVVGSLSLMGLNSEGLAVGTTNIRTLDARPGVPYTSLLHKALSMLDIEKAGAAILGARRAGGHTYALLDCVYQSVFLECSATETYALMSLEEPHVHTNHCQYPVNQEMEAPQGEQASSYARKKRMKGLLLEQWGELDTDYLQACLEDTEGGKLAICRDDIDGVSTNAAVIITPGYGHMKVCHGLPGPDKWQALM